LEDLPSPRPKSRFIIFFEKNKVSDLQFASNVFRIDGRLINSLKMESEANKLAQKILAV